MTTVISRNSCVKCGKQNAIIKCDGCLQGFCYNDFGNHRQELNKQLDEVEVNRDLIQQSLNEQKTQPKKHPLIQQIDQWEEESIKKIKQIAEENRNLFLGFTNRYINRIEFKLNNLTNQLKQSRQENDFIETNLNEWNKQLIEFKEELIKPSNININYHSTPFITKIDVDIPLPLWIPNININAKWIQNGITVAGGNGQGNELNQLYNPSGVYIDDDQTIYVADYKNHRIVEWKSGATSGQVVAGGNGPGNRNDQLNYPGNVIVDQETDCLIISDSGNKRVARWPRRNGSSAETIISNIDCSGSTMDKNGYLYVSDFSKHEVRRWKIGDTNGTIVAGGNGPGNRLDQLNTPYYIFVDQDHSVYVSDCGNHRVMKWMKDAKEGIVVAGGQGQGNSLTQLSNALGIFVDQLGTLYVADQRNHRVMRWLKGATRGSVIVGGNGSGAQANQFGCPFGLFFDRQNSLYVVDHFNNRVQKFDIESN